MKARSRREKGSRFERKVAKLVVTALASKGIVLEDCYRTPNSGGHMRASKHDPGDLVVSPRLRRYFPFSVECKCYKSLDWHKLFEKDSKRNHWAKWWKQACVAASFDSALTPLLVFKENRGSAFAMLPAVWKDKGVTPKFRPVLITRVNGIRVRVVRFDALLRILACSE